jgi:hypothetical protein
VHKFFSWCMTAPLLSFHFPCLHWVLPFFSLGLGASRTIHIHLLPLAHVSSKARQPDTSYVNTPPLLHRRCFHHMLPDWKIVTEPPDHWLKTKLLSLHSQPPFLGSCPYSPNCAGIYSSKHKLCFLQLLTPFYPLQSSEVTAEFILAVPSKKVLPHSNALFFLILALKHNLYKYYAFIEGSFF